MALLDDGRNVWVVADAGRLRDDWTNASAIREVIREEMYPVQVVDGGAVVYRTKPPNAQAASEPDGPAVPRGGDPPVRAPW
jgi:hypothetical protein